MLLIVNSSKDEEAGAGNVAQWGSICLLGTMPWVGASAPAKQNFKKRSRKVVVRV